MVDLIDFQVSFEGNTKEEDEACDSDLDSLNAFIDDENDDIENDRTFYKKFENVTNSADDVLKAEYDKSITDIDKIDLSNFCETSEEETEIDDFKDTEKRIKKFKETLFPISTNDDNNENYNSLVNAIFFARRFNIEQKTDLCSINELKEVIDNNLFDQSNQKEFNLVLDYQKFNNQCHEINMLLAKRRYFLRVFEL